MEVGVYERMAAAAGSVDELCRRLSVSRQALHQWKTRRVPAERVLDVERATGGQVSRHELRPDIYPPAEAAE